MIKQLLKKWPIDIKKSFMIGDRLSDKQCAKKVSYFLNFQKEIFTFR